MKTKIIALTLAIAALCSIFSVSAMAADYSTNYKAYSQPSTSGDYAYWNEKKVVRASGTTVSKVKWMQAALNYCIANKGLNASKLNVDGSFEPASKTTTQTASSNRLPRIGRVFDGGGNVIIQLAEPKFKTPLYYEAIRNGILIESKDRTELIKLKNLKCPNCEFHIGDKVIGIDSLQPFMCPKCKGVFAFDLRYFRTVRGIGRRIEKWRQEAGIC